MPLSQSDLNRISNLGYNIHSFSLKNGSDRQLKNYSDECVFLGKKGCKIYPYRPEGCLLYPLIYDEETEDFVLDSVCPYAKEFIVRKVDKQKLIDLLKKLQSDTF
jgi:Fe-S-cluster containining protein